jgi:hypothetical protein
MVIINDLDDFIQLDTNGPQGTALGAGVIQDLLNSIPLEESQYVGITKLEGFSHDSPKFTNLYHSKSFFVSLEILTIPNPKKPTTTNSSPKEKIYPKEFDL